METEATLNLYQKLEKIRSMCDVAQKSKKGFNYTYTDITEILANVTAGMKKYSVMLIPSMVPGTQVVGQNVVRNVKFDKTGKAIETVATEMLFESQMNFTWIDNQNPTDTITVPWFVTGSMPDVSQGLGAACSYGMRQFLTSFFQIAQSDNDVDAYRSKQKAAEVAEEKAIAKQIIDELDKRVRSYLEAHPDQAESVKKLMMKYVKNGNYLAIAEQSLAAKLLDEFTKTFTTEEK